MSDNRSVSVLNIHWGFSIGGVSQYAAVFDQVREHAPIEMSTVCIISRKGHVDEQSLARLSGLRLIKRNGPFDLRWVAALRTQIEKLAPQLVITHGFNAHIVAFFIRFLVRRKPVFIASYHGEYHPPTPKKKLVEGLYNGFTAFYMRRIAQSVVSVAECGKKHLISRGVAPGKITVIHNGIPDYTPDDIDREALRRELELPVDALVIGIVSRLEPIKGIPYLLQAIQLIIGEFANVYLVIIGSGVQESSLRTLAQELGIHANVKFAGFKSNASRYFPALDIFALPSLSEFHSIGLLEAMRASTAIVATDVGGNTESVSNDKQGLIVRPANVDELAVALRRLLSSEDLRARLGKAARERFVGEFTVNTMIKLSAEYLMRAAGDQVSAQ